MFAYCNNNPVIYKDSDGKAIETIVDVVSLAISAVEVATNPTDLSAWAGLMGDAVDLIPFVTGVGETIRALRAADKVTDGADRLIDTYRRLKQANKGSGLEVHHIVEKRFHDLFGYVDKKGRSMPSIALSPEDHQVYTNAWRELVEYGKEASIAQVINAAAKIYSDDAKLMGATIYTMTRNYLK